MKFNFRKKRPGNGIELRVFRNDCLSELKVCPITFIAPAHAILVHFYPVTEKECSKLIGELKIQ